MAVEVDALIAMDSLTNDQLAVIETIRQAMAGGLTSGRVRAARAPKVDGDNLFQAHPTYTALAPSEQVDAIVVDDRYVNQYPNMTVEGRITPIVNTLDILDHLAAEGALTSAQLLGHRTFLRRAGYQLIPVTEDELRAHIMAAKIVGGALGETAELKAIREALLRARMNKMVQLPLELPFLQSTQLSVMRMIREVWETAASTEEAIARADWLLRLADVRSWASSVLAGNERDFAIFAYAQHVQHLISLPITANEALRERYFDWITDRVLAQVKDSQPEVFEWLLARFKESMKAGVAEASKKVGT